MLPQAPGCNLSRQPERSRVVQGTVGTVRTTAQAFEAFVAARQQALWRSAWLLTGDAALAEDLVQTALIKSWPHWAKLVADRAEEAYVRRVLFTTHASWWRRRWQGEVVTDNLPEPKSSAAPADPDVQETVRLALMGLPPRQRAAVVLRYFDDLTETQTAHVLNCSVGTVKSQTSRALSRLRAHPGLSDLLVQGARR